MIAKAVCNQSEIRKCNSWIQRNQDFLYSCHV